VNIPPSSRLLPQIGVGASCWTSYRLRAKLDDAKKKKWIEAPIFVLDNHALTAPNKIPTEPIPAEKINVSVHIDMDSPLILMGSTARVKLTIRNKSDAKVTGVSLKLNADTILQTSSSRRHIKSLIASTMIDDKALFPINPGEEKTAVASFGIPSRGILPTMTPQQSPLVHVSHLIKAKALVAGSSEQPSASISVMLAEERPALVSSIMPPRQPQGVPGQFLVRGQSAYQPTPIILPPDMNSKTTSYAFQMSLAPYLANATAFVPASVISAPMDDEEPFEADEWTAWRQLQPSSSQGSSGASHGSGVPHPGVPQI